MAAHMNPDVNLPKFQALSLEDQPKSQSSSPGLNGTKSPSPEPTMSNIVILGAGIIGVSTAYYLSESGRTPPSSIHIVEPSPELFASASGYAGGFLARDWFAPSTVSLGRLSFDLHQSLAHKHNGRQRWGFSPSTGSSLAHEGWEIGAAKGEDWLKEGNSRAQAAEKMDVDVDTEGPTWLTRRNGARVEVISEGNVTAQCDPLKLSQFLLDECLKRGVQLHQPAEAISVSKDSQGELSSVRIADASAKTETDLPCHRVIITAGAWTHKAFAKLFPTATIKIPVSQLAGYSIIVKSPRWKEEDEQKGCHAVFATASLGFSPELLSRLGGEIYVAGLNSATIPLPNLPTETVIDPEMIEQLRTTSARLLAIPGVPNDLEILKEGLCFRPVTPNGRPLLTRVPDSRLGDISTRGGGEGGVFVCAGHGPWGISLSLGSGKVLAEMVEGLPTTSANVRALAL
ncbi:MAG: hypothetical protein M1819_001714 [Sarea resinae]|nr:MAG: hypothetical protein M1819_001714 [Sarea resinae]